MQTPPLKANRKASTDVAIIILRLPSYHLLPTPLQSKSSLDPPVVPLASTRLTSHRLCLITNTTSTSPIVTALQLLLSIPLPSRFINDIDQPTDLSKNVHPDMVHHSMQHNTNTRRLMCVFKSEIYTLLLALAPNTQVHLV